MCLVYNFLMINNKFFYCILSSSLFFAKFVSVEFASNTDAFCKALGYHPHPDIFQVFLAGFPNLLVVVVFL